MAGYVFLHVGPPKAGMSFIQAVLWNNADALSAQGYDLAARELAEHGQAAGELTGMRTGNKAAGGWDRQVTRIHGATGSVIMSQADLSRATAAQVGQVVEALHPSPIMVVITPRDLARQVSAYWQQSLKRQNALTLPEMAKAIRDHDPEAERFWSGQDVLVAVDRWLEHLPADRIVIAPVPPEGTGQEVLWERFAEAVQLDGSQFNLDVAVDKESLGAAQAEVLRRMNVSLSEHPDDEYHAVPVRLVSSLLLGSVASPEYFGIDEETHAWATERSQSIIDGISERGLRVIGDLDDLVPAPWEPSIEPAESAEPAVAAAAIQALVDLVVRWPERLGQPAVLSVKSGRGGGRGGKGGGKGGGGKGGGNGPEGKRRKKGAHGGGGRAARVEEDSAALDAPGGPFV